MPSDGDHDSASGTDSIQVSMDACDNATKKALKAAHNVEVGDYYFEAKNYAAASLRYNDALVEKPQDPAIHVRLGRVLEKLGPASRGDRAVQSSAKACWPGGVVR